MSFRAKEKEIRGDGGKLICVCRVGEEASNPILETKNDSICFQDFLKEVLSIANQPPDRKKKGEC